MSERLLGPIVLLQVQRTPLKAPGGLYDPRPLLAVGEAAVGPEGMAGFHEGAWVSTPTTPPTRPAGGAAGPSPSGSPGTTG